MNDKQRKDLLKVAELIATEKTNMICYTLKSIKSDLNIYQDPVCKMFDPTAVVWWGIDTMNVFADSPEARNARLLGIAFMLTMPEDMVED